MDQLDEYTPFKYIGLSKPIDGYDVIHVRPIFEVNDCHKARFVRD